MLNNKGSLRTDSLTLRAVGILVGPGDDVNKEDQICYKQL